MAALQPLQAREACLLAFLPDGAGIREPEGPGAEACVPIHGPRCVPGMGAALEVSKEGRHFLELLHPCGQPFVGLGLVESHALRSVVLDGRHAPQRERVVLPGRALQVSPYSASRITGAASRSASSSPISR